MASFNDGTSNAPAETRYGTTATIASPFGTSTAASHFRARHPMECTTTAAYGAHAARALVGRVRDTLGGGAAVRMEMEWLALERLPARPAHLPRANLAYDALMGRLDDMDVADVFKPEPTAPLYCGN